MSELKTTYCGVEIVYEEHESKFVFELRGRERKVDTIKEAKAIIDKPEPKEKSNFERVPVWVSKYGGPEFTEGTITSIAERPSYCRTEQVWVVVNGTRTRESAEHCFPKNEMNDAIVSKCRDLESKRVALREEQETHRKGLQHFGLGLGVAK